MKKLIWKELMEMRYFPFANGALVLALTLSRYVMGSWTVAHGGAQADRMTIDDVVLLSLLGLVSCGVLAGSSSVSTESAHGTLTFLDSLPVSRLRIWLSKLAAGAVVAMASGFLVLSVMTFLVLSIFRAWPNVGVVVDAVYPMHIFSLFPVPTALVFGTLGAITALCFASSMLFSAVFDRILAVSTVSLTVAGCFGYWVLSQQGELLETWKGQAMLLVYLPLFCAASLLITSYLTFRWTSALGAVKGKVAGVGLAVILLLVGVSVLKGYTYAETLAWLEYPDPTPAVHKWVTTTVGGKKTDLLAFESENVLWTRVKAGKTYLETDDIGPGNRLLTVPVRTIDSSTAIHSQIRYFQHPDHRYYILAYTYTPRIPLGRDNQEITVIGTDGLPIRTLEITAWKADGLFPPLRWFVQDSEGYNGSLIKNSKPLTE